MKLSTVFGACSGISETVNEPRFVTIVAVGMRFSSSDSGVARDVREAYPPFGVRRVERSTAPPAG